MKRFFQLFLFTSLIISYLSAFQAMGQEFTLVPSLDFGGVYNSNVQFERYDELSTYSIIVKPALNLNYASESLDIFSRAEVEFERYLEHKEIDHENQWYFFKGKYELTERWTLLGEIDYVDGPSLTRVRDMSLGYRDPEIVVNVLLDRKRTDALININYKLSQISDIGIICEYYKTTFPDNPLDNRDQYDIALIYNRQFYNLPGRFSITPKYSHFESEATIADDYKLSFGWSHQFSRTFFVGVDLGGRYTENFYEDDRDTVTTWGAAADISLQKMDEISSSRIGYKHDIFISLDGELINIDGFYCDLRRNITDRLSIGFYAFIYFPTYEDEFNFEDNYSDWAVHSNYYELAPSLYYNFTENYSLELGGDYTLYSQAERQRTRIWLVLKLRFPRNW